MQKAIALQPALRNTLEIRFIGNVEPVNIARIKDSGLEDLFFLSGYVKHAEAVQYTYVTDILFLFIKLDLDASKDTITIPGKFFEYLGAYRPILFLGPKCEVTEILDETQQGWHPALNAEAIGTLLAEICTKNEPFEANKTLIGRYDRKVQAKVFSDLVFATSSRVAATSS